MELSIVFHLNTCATQTMKVELLLLDFHHFEFSQLPKSWNYLSRSSLLITAWAAARRAGGTLYGEQLTYAKPSC